MSPSRAPNGGARILAQGADGAIDAGKPWERGQGIERAPTGGDCVGYAASRAQSAAAGYADTYPLTTASLAPTSTSNSRGQGR